MVVMNPYCWRVDGHSVEGNSTEGELLSVVRVGVRDEVQTEWLSEDDSASAYVLRPLNPFFVLIYEG